MRTSLFGCEKNRIYFRLEEHKRTDYYFFTKMLYKEYFL